ncbi:MAG: RHS repeat-associated core domain-containing protein [Fulvivirga sp.]
MGTAPFGEELVADGMEIVVYESFGGAFYISEIILHKSKSLVSPILSEVSTSSSEIEISWGAVSGASSYSVYLNGAYRGSTSGTSYTFTGISRGSSHKIEVKAHDNISLSPALDEFVDIFDWTYESELESLYVTISYECDPALEPNGICVEIDEEISHNPIHNGNISAIRWRSVNDEDEQLYTYGYDGLNRLINAKYAAKGSGSYDSKQGHYSLPNISYDLNGNITTLTRQGKNAKDLIDEIDNLTYNYGSGGNQLKAVVDTEVQDGFKDGNKGIDDYTYDANGNMTKDLNSGIINIVYNYLDLPKRVNFGNGDYITYKYDASGIKLQQLVYESGNLKKKTDYIGNFIYETLEDGDRQLRLIQHEEGRIVPTYDMEHGTFEYQYYLKDHLGNNRVTFTTNPKEIDFKLNYESNTADPDDEALFDNLQNVITADVHDRVDAANESFNHNQVQLLNGATNGVVGSILTIPVGPGDKVSAEVYAKYLAPTGTNNPAAAIGNLVLGAITGSTGVNNYEGAINNGYGTNGTVTNLINTNASSTEPMAFINLLFLLDDETNTIESSHFAFKQVTPASSNNQALLSLDQPYEAPEAGYVVVYLSNESAQLTEVYFDDLEVTVEESKIIQTADYYPFGMEMAGGYQRITARENKFKYNGKELQEETGWLDYGARMYQPEIGRFFTQDRFAEKYYGLSPYQYAANNPIRYIDVNGDSIDVYDPSGNLVMTLDDGKEKVTGMYFQKSKTNKKGKTTYSNGVSFEYNDAELDREGAKNDGLKVRFADRDINGIMEKSGVNSDAAQDSPWSYIERESRPKGDESILSGKSSGKMDYLNYTKYGYLNIVRGPNGDRVAYNDFDYGNFLWGMGGKKLGFSYRTLQGASHLNNAVNSKSDNPGVPYRILDSNADQRAIRNGYYYGVKPQQSDPQE